MQNYISMPFSTLVSSSLKFNTLLLTYKQFFNNTLKDLCLRSSASLLHNTMVELRLS